MYFQFLIEDHSTEILVRRVMEKVCRIYSDKLISYDCKSFTGIGGFVKKGNPLEQKTGKLLNDLSIYLKGFDKKLQSMPQSVIFIVLDNDKRQKDVFNKNLEEIATNCMLLTDHVFCIAVKEMEAWLLGDTNAINQAYPGWKKSAIRPYEQDGICETWEVLANAVYPGGLAALKKKAAGTYGEIGKMKAEWADKIGQYLSLEENVSPSFQFFVKELRKRAEIA